MAYLQITTKCNMTCAHCCNRCTMRGKHMSREVYKAAIEWASYEGESVAIGGGEPTLHPDFWEILGLCLGTFDSVWMATNGSQTRIAVVLAKMAQKGILGCELSQDEFHDPIDPEVRAAFGREYDRYGSANNDLRGVRTTSKQGWEQMAPFRNPEDGGSVENCCCTDLVITPSGKIKACGCIDAPTIGNVWDGITVSDFPDEGFGGECWRKLTKEDGSPFFARKLARALKKDSQ